MIRIAHIADLHVLEGRGAESRLEDQAADLARLVDRLLERQPHVWLVAGDLYGHSVPHRPTPNERAVLEPQLIRMAECGPVFVDMGNHDHEVATPLIAQLGGLFPITVITDARARRISTPGGDLDLYPMAFPTDRLFVGKADAPPGIEDSRRLVSKRLGSLLAAWSGRIARRRRDAPDVAQVAMFHAQVRGSVVGGGEILMGGDIELERAALDGLGADYVAAGHIHKRQEFCPRGFYSGSPWPKDWSEGRDLHGGNLVSIGRDVPTHVIPDANGKLYTATAGGPLAAAVEFVPSGSRRWITLEYRWAADQEEGEPRWVRSPSPSELAEVEGAEVRARLTMPDYAAASCPWAAVLEGLRGLGAHRVTPAPSVEPTLRIRAPEVVEALDHPSELLAYLGTLAPPPSEVETGDARDALAELLTSEDSAISARTKEFSAA